MPFQPHRKQTEYLRKEHDSFIAIIEIPPIRYERVSGFASRGSITAEASIVVSIFFFAVLAMASLLEIMYLQTSIKNALCSVGKQMAAESYFQPMVLTKQMEKRMVEILGEEFFDSSYIANGKDGLDCSRSRSYLTTTIMELTVDYQIELPFLIFDLPLLSRSETIRIKGWTGKESLGTGEGDYEIVYMTEHGVVYHEDLSCTHLELTIRPIAKGGIESYRNKGGETYSPCEYCGFLSILRKTVYITEQGNRYHTTLNCQGLKRNIYTVLKKDVYGIGGCSKCVK